MSQYNVPDKSAGETWTSDEHNMLKFAVNDNDDRIGQTITNVAGNSAAISDLEAEQLIQDGIIAGNTTAISTNAGTIATNAANIGTLQTSQAAQDATIAQNEADIDALEAEQTTQTAAIASNTTTIVGNANDIDALETEVAALGTSAPLDVPAMAGAEASATEVVRGDDPRLNAAPALFQLLDECAGPISNPGNVSIVLAPVTVVTAGDFLFTITGTNITGTGGFSIGSSAGATDVFSVTDRITAAVPTRQVTVTLEPGVYYPLVWAGGGSSIDEICLEATSPSGNAGSSIISVGSECFSQLVAGTAASYGSVPFASSNGGGTDNTAGSGNPNGGVLGGTISIPFAGTYAVTHTGTNVDGGAGSGFGINSTPYASTNAAALTTEVIGSDVFTSTANRISAAEPSKTYRITFPTAGDYYVGFFSGGTNSTDAHALTIDTLINTINSAVLGGAGAVTPVASWVADSDGEVSTISWLHSQLQTNNAGSTASVVVTNLTTGDSESSSFNPGTLGVTFGNPPTEVTRTLAAAVPFSEGDSLQVSYSDNNGNSWGISSATSGDLSWELGFSESPAISLTGSVSTEIELQKTVDQATGDVAHFDIDGNEVDTVPLTLVTDKSTPTTPEWVKEQCHLRPSGTEFSVPTSSNNGDMLATAGASAPVTAPLRISNNGTVPFEINSIRIRAGANGFTTTGSLTLGGVNYTRDVTVNPDENISGIYRTLVFVPASQPLVVEPNETFQSTGNWGSMTGGFQGPVLSAAGTNPPFGGGNQARAEIEYTLETPTRESVTVRTLNDGSLWEVNCDDLTLTQVSQGEVDGWPLKLSSQKGSLLNQSVGVGQPNVIGSADITDDTITTSRLTVVFPQPFEEAPDISDINITMAGNGTGNSSITNLRIEAGSVTNTGFNILVSDFLTSSIDVYWKVTSS